MERTLIAPGVHLSCDPAEKFNRCRISVHFAFPAKRETATAHALLPLVLASLSTLSELLTSFVPGFGFLVAILVVLTPLMLVVFGAALIYNGILMWRREGARIPNLLSLIAGILVFSLQRSGVLRSMQSSLS